VLKYPYEVVDLHSYFAFVFFNDIFQNRIKPIYYIEMPKMPKMHFFSTDSYPGIGGDTLPVELSIVVGHCGGRGGITTFI
jgi:hypothetical protein